MKKSLVYLIVIFLIAINFFSASGKVQTNIDSYKEKQLKESYENFGFGYRLYDPDSQYDPGPVFFKLDDPGAVYTLSYNNNTITGGCYNPYTYTWFVCDDMSYIWTIDIWSGDITLINGSGEGFSALAYDPQTNTMYGAYETFLCGIDMQTGERLWVWDIYEYSLGLILGMAANGNGHLYIVDTFSKLWQLDLETFTLTIIGPLNINIKGNADLEFDFNTGILYLSAYTTQGELYTVNTWIGEATLVGSFEDGAGISGFIIPWNWPPSPPESPQISGPKHGKINIKYEYKFVSIDPDDDLLTYIIDWDDGCIEEFGFYPSGEEITVKHAWSEERTYTIKAKARDIFGLESSWSNFDIVIPKSKTMDIFIQWISNRLPNAFPIIQFILGLKS
jgi:hypothetical protein